MTEQQPEEGYQESVTLAEALGIHPLEQGLFNTWYRVTQSRTEPALPEKTKPVNPCIALYGAGPDGQTCKGCTHLRYPLMRNPKAHHWKCDLRKLSHGAATDHRVTWQACTKYEKRTEPYHGG